MVKQILRYWPQMVNCRNPKCRMGCAANPDTLPHGPYIYGDVLIHGNKTRRVYIGKDVDDWLENLNAEQDTELELPEISAGAPMNRAPKPKKPKAKATAKACPVKAQVSAPKPPPLTPAQVAAKAFLDKKPTAKDALAFLGAAGANKDAITKAYRKASLIAHPDKGGSTLEMQAVNTAKAILAKWVK